MTLTALAAVATGAAIGGIARYGVGLSIGALGVTRFPFATLLVNASGSFIAGAVLMMVLKGQLSETMRLFLIVGICGALTTFSAFALETVQLLQQELWWKATGNVFLNIVCSLLAVVLGASLVKAVSG